MVRLSRAARKEAESRQAVLHPGAAALYPVPPKADVAAMARGLAAMDRYAGAGADAPLDQESPIFIAGVGWRVGSTLLQRLCCSDKSAVIWGEVLGNMGLLNRISEAFCIARPDGWPFEDMWLEQGARGQEQTETLSDEFIANLYPASSHLREGLQQLVYRWLGEPARKLGFERWGLKETRLSAADALFLRWLFPKAVFLPLVRDPFDAYQSCRAAGGDHWIEPRTNTPERFAEHWNRLAMSWVDGKDQISERVIRYEDLVAGDFDFDELTQRTGLAISPKEVMSRKAGASKRKDLFRLSRRHRSVIRRIAGDGMRAFGYDVRS
jgi:hypothetical protein